MKNKLLVISMAAMISLGLSACAPNISPDTVSASNANEVQTAVEGVIVSKRIVTVKGDSNMVGTLAGGIIGAVAGSSVGGGNMRYITGTAGAVAGGAAGNVIEDKLTTQQGIEYVVKLTQEDGPTTTISSNGQSSISATSSDKDFGSGNNPQGTSSASITGNSSASAKGKNSSTTTISSKSAANRYVTVIQGQGSQALPVGQKVLVAGVNSGHAHIISTL